MISAVTVRPTTRQLRRIGRLCSGYGNEQVKVTFHRSGVVRLIIPDGEDARHGHVYLIGSKGAVTHEEIV